MRKKRKYNKTRIDTSNKAKKVAKKKLRKGAAPKTRGNGTLTEGEYFSRVRSALRRVFRWWPPMIKALNKASRPSQNANKRIQKEYQCAKCLAWKTRKEVEIDHVEECGSLSKYEDIVPFLKRLTREEENAYQILCKDTCHIEKTKAYKAQKKK
jgi:hypothetical protein